MNPVPPPKSFRCPLPAPLSALMAPPPLLPGESLEAFEAIKQAIIEEMAPQTPLEWLWVIDMIELSWDILRYRRLRQKVLEASREAAIEASLARIDLAGVSQECLVPARRHIKSNAAAWRSDPTAAAEIEGRLLANGVDTDATNLDLFDQGRELFLLFDTLLNAAQNRRIMVLREIEGRRFARRRLGRV